MHEGVLPHFFNTAENLDYVGPYPETEFYEADYMSGDKRPRFLEWHESKKAKFSVIRKSSSTTAWMNRCNSRIYPSLYT